MSNLHQYQVAYVVNEEYTNREVVLARNADHARAKKEHHYKGKKNKIRVIAVVPLDLG